MTRLWPLILVTLAKYVFVTPRTIGAVHSKILFPSRCCMRQGTPPVNEAHQGPSRPRLTGPNYRGYPSSEGFDIPLEFEPFSPGRIEARLLLERMPFPKRAA